MKLLENMTSLWSKIQLYVIGGGLLAIIAMGGYIAWQSGKMEAQKTKLDKATEQVETLTTQFSQFKTEAQRMIDDMAMQNRETQAALDTARKREKEIRNVPKNQDAGVAPVLFDSLSRLR